MKEHLITMSDLAVATNLPLVLERQPSPELHITGSLFPNAKPIPLQRNNHHNLNIACAGGLDFPKALLDRITPPLDWSSLSSNQSSNPAADQANRQQRIRINYSDLETTPSSSCLTSSLQLTLLSWTPIASMNIPAVTEGKGEDLSNKTNHRPVSGHFVAQIIVPPHHSSISTAKIIEETPRLVTAINVSLSNSEQLATHTCLNRSTRWSAPTPLVVPTDEAKWRHHLRIKSSYAKVDPFPSPTPGKRFSNIGTPGDHSPRQASLPDWVIHEYLSAGDNRKKLDPRGPLNSLRIHPTCNSQSKQQDDKHTTKTNSDSLSASQTSTSNTSKRCRFTSTCSHFSCAPYLPTPGKVFYPLLDQSQVTKFNKNNHIHSFDSLMSPKGRHAVPLVKKSINHSHSRSGKSSLKNRIKKLLFSPLKKTLNIS